MLFVAEGYRPQFAKKLDPAKQSAEIKLEAIPAESPQPDHVVRGRVRDAQGAPVMGATIWPRMTYYSDGTGTSACTGLDPVAISNRRGEFELRCTLSLKSVDLQVEARGLAKRNVSAAPSGNQITDIRLTDGATVSGHLLWGGKPCVGVAVGLVQCSRRGDTFLGEYTIGTDKDGRFQFLNVAPGFDYYVYGKMNSLRDKGAAAVRKIRVEKDGATVDAGTIKVEAGHKVAGRVVLSDGGAIPPGTRLLMGREAAWDTQIVELDKEGRFELHGLPTENYSVSVRVKGYRPSAKNVSLDPRNARLVGRVASDIEDFILLLEPGERRAPDYRAVKRPKPGTALQGAPPQ